MKKVSVIGASPLHRIPATQRQRTPVFRLYSSPPFTVSSGVDAAVPPTGAVLLAP